jgi:aminopeptidase N
MTRDAELATRDLVRLVIGNLPGETDIGVVQSLLAKAELAIYAYGDPGNREAALTSLADAAYSAAQASPPASDFQLAWLRSFASTARTEQQLDVVADLLTGAHTLPGLEVDTELRWALLGALVTAGRAGPPEIDAELARDNTAAGVRHAAAARAAQPTREAKEAAFRSIFDDDALPNAMLGATIGGFQQPDQVELVGEFTERYFDSLARVWETRSNEMAFTAITGMYPATQVSQETVDRTDRYLREAEPAFPVRRLLIEGRDGVSRALRARAKDAAKDGARH